MRRQLIMPFRRHMVIFSFCVMELLFHIWSEIIVIKGGQIDDFYMIPYGIFRIIFAFVCFLVILRSLKAGDLKGCTFAFLVLLLLISSIVWRSEVVAVEMHAKALFFNKFKNLCPKSTSVDGGAQHICYEYSVVVGTGDRELIIFDKTDEVAEGMNDWSNRIKDFLNATKMPGECALLNSKKIVDGVYVISNANCWQ